MTVSKRTRFEVLKRDNHTCRYCGATAEDGPLTVDHVTPVALGGGDDPANLVAACRDCNYGKASTSPDASLVEEVGQDAIRWANAVKTAATSMLEEHARDADRHDWFVSAWEVWDKELDLLPEGWAASLDHWIGAGLPRTILLDCLDIAVTNRGVSHNKVFAYMGGVARKKIEKLHEQARKIIDGDAGVVDDGA